MIKAIARGKLFGGNVDCFVLEDERRVIAVGGVTKAVGAHGNASLAQYIGKLPSRYQALASPTVFEIAIPGGGVARCHDAEYLIDVCHAYVQAMGAGELHSSQKKPLQLRFN